MACYADEGRPFLLKLPSELRLQIYRYVVPSGNLTVSSGPDLSRLRKQQSFQGDSHQSARKSTRIAASQASTGNNIQKTPQRPTQMGEDVRSVARETDKIVDRERPRCSKIKVRAGGSIPGIPIDHYPILQEGYHEDIIEFHMRGLPSPAAVLKPVYVRTSSKAKTTHLAYPCSALPMLHLTCRQIHEELLSLPLSACLVDLHLSYPGGVCALMHCFPNLLNYARKVRIVGNFDLETANGIEEHGLGPGIWEGKSMESDARQSKEMSDVADAIRALRRMTSFLLGEEATLAMAQNMSKATNEQNEREPSVIFDRRGGLKERTIANPKSRKLQHPPLARPRPFTVLTSRIFYPQSPDDVHPSPPRSIAPTIRQHTHPVFSCRLSPTTNQLAVIASGDLRLTVARGSGGTGMELVAKYNGGWPTHREYLWPSFNEDLSSDGAEWVLPAGGSGGWDALELGFERPRE